MTEPRRSYKLIVERMLKSPVKIVCDDFADVKTCQAALHACYRRYAPAMKLTTRREKVKGSRKFALYASLCV
jgi:hypothetical protein